MLSMFASFAVERRLFHKLAKERPRPKSGPRAVFARICTRGRRANKVLLLGSLAPRTVHQLWPPSPVWLSTHVSILILTRRGSQRSKLRVNLDIVQRRPSATPPNPA